MKEDYNCLFVFCIIQQFNSNSFNNNKGSEELLTNQHLKKRMLYKMLLVLHGIVLLIVYIL